MQKAAALGAVYFALLLIVLFSVSSFEPNIEAYAQKKTIVSVINSNLRSKPSLEERYIVKSIPQLSALKVLDAKESDDIIWLNVQFEGNDYWISEHSVEVLKPKQSKLYAAIKSRKLNIRVSPSPDSTKMGYVVTGDIVEVLELYENGWAKIRYKDFIGYSYSGLLNIFNFYDSVSETSNFSDIALASFNFIDSPTQRDLRKYSNSVQNISIVSGLIDSDSWDNTLTLRNNIYSEKPNYKRMRPLVERKLGTIWDNKKDKRLPVVLNEKSGELVYFWKADKGIRWGNIKSLI